MNHRRSLAYIKARPAIGAVLAIVATLGGCSRQNRGAPVDAPLAREALRTALDGWKKGDAPSSFKDASPSMTVQDLDWLAGARLVEYHVVDDGKAVEANLYVPVKLTLRTAKGKEVRKSVNYVVGTSPILTVFRALN